METDGFYNWVFKKDRPGCFKVFLGFLFVICTWGPIFILEPVRYYDTVEPGELYFTLLFMTPLVALGVLSDSKRNKASFSRAYLCTFIILSVASVIYIGYILFSDKYRYELIGDELIRKLIIMPLYYAGLSLLFFIVEIIANAIAKRREHNLNSKEEI